MPTVAPILILTLLLLTVAFLVIVDWPDAQKRRLLLASAALLGVAAGVMILMTPPAGAEWSTWRTSVSQSIAACNADEDGSLCLAQTLHSLPPPAQPPADASVAQRFFEDVRIGENLQEIQTASDLLYKEFGIDSKEFIGTGYSVPEDANDVNRGYFEATQREFFVRNLCADSVDSHVCPQEVDTMWTWKLTPAQASALMSRPVTDLLNSTAPIDHIDQWRALQRTHPSNLLIRFARFKPQYYAGTVGRAENNLVFFTSLQAANQGTLNDVMIRTGSAALAQPGKPDEVLFVWVYAPPADQPAQPATWRAVFDYLSTLNAQPAH